MERGGRAFAPAEDGEPDAPDAAEVADGSVDHCSGHAVEAVLAGHAVAEGGAAARVGVDVLEDGDERARGVGEGLVVRGEGVLARGDALVRVCGRSPP